MSSVELDVNLDPQNSIELIVQFRVLNLIELLNLDKQSMP